LLIEINKEAFKGRWLLRRSIWRNLFLERLNLKIVPIGRLEFMVKPGKRIRVETSYIESVIRIASVLMNCDYLKEFKCSIETLGISKYSVSGIKNHLA